MTMDRLRPLDRLRDAVRRTEAVTRGRALTGTRHDDADDIVGTIASDDAHGFDPFPLLRSFHAAGVGVVVIGQVAGILHGSTELTGDLDLLWDGDHARADAMATAFARVGVRVTDDDGGPFDLGPAAFRLRKVQFASPQASGDCCTLALDWGPVDVARFFARADTAVDADGSEIHYLRRDDLIAMRRAVGRPKDLRRADELDLRA
jgi:hypothetical protein